MFPSTLSETQNGMTMVAAKARVLRPCSCEMETHSTSRTGDSIPSIRLPFPFRNEPKTSRKSVRGRVVEELVLARLSQVHCSPKVVEDESLIVKSLSCLTVGSFYSALRKSAESMTRFA
uniref:Uncharacterized protein n=1 Tax=Solanum tuberosum TaxID=4113 RepID=M1AUS0_SOLTU